MTKNILLFILIFIQSIIAFSQEKIEAKFTYKNNNEKYKIVLLNNYIKRIDNFNINNISYIYKEIFKMSGEKERKNNLNWIIYYIYNTDKKILTFSIDKKRCNSLNSFEGDVVFTLYEFNDDYLLYRISYYDAQGKFTNIADDFGIPSLTLYEFNDLEKIIRYCYKKDINDGNINITVKEFDSNNKIINAQQISVSQYQKILEIFENK